MKTQSRCSRFASYGGKVAATLGNPAMIDAYKQGIPENGKPFPDGAKMAKIHWIPKKEESYPGQPIVPGAFDYDEASGTFRPANATSRPPQGNDAKCGLACHTEVLNRDYVFTAYGKR